MRICGRVWFVATALSTALAASARADFLIYDLGAEGQTLVRVAEGGRSLDRSAFDTRIVLQGKVVVNPGGTVSYTHSSGKKVHFKLGERIEYKKAPTTREEFGKMLGAAGRNTDAIMKAGVWALKKALLPDFYRAVDKVLDIDPKHEAALKVMWSPAALDNIRISADGLMSDIHGSSDYRANLIKVMAQRAVQQSG